MLNFIAVMSLSIGASLADVPKVSIVPNPASSIMNIAVQASDINSVKIQLFTVLGTEVNGVDLRASDVKGNYQMNVSSLPEGIYLLTVSSGKEQIVRRIKIQH